MDITDRSFEENLAWRLRQELDAVSVTIPGLRPVTHRVRLLPAALAASLLAVLLLGSSLVSGNPNPVNWVGTAGHSVGHKPTVHAAAPKSPVKSAAPAPKTPAQTRPPQEAPESPRPGEHDRYSQPASGERYSD